VAESDPVGREGAMRTRYVTGLLVTAVLVAMLPGTADARSGDRTYAVALGDSLSVG